MPKKKYPEWIELRPRYTNNVVRFPARLTKTRIVVSHGGNEVVYYNPTATWPSLGWTKQAQHSYTTSLPWTIPADANASPAIIERLRAVADQAVCDAWDNRKVRLMNIAQCAWAAAIKDATRRLVGECQNNDPQGTEGSALVVLTLAHDLHVVSRKRWQDYTDKDALAELNAGCPVGCDPLVLE